MLKISGIYASAIIYAHTAEASAMEQLSAVCDNESAANSKIRLMPNVRPGRPGPAGITMTVGSTVMPGLVGSDVGCGISYIRIQEREIEYPALDAVIRETIPVGAEPRKEPHFYSRDFNFADLICRKHINEQRARLSLGTLGGGDHFLKMSRDEQGNLYMAVHSGSLSLGKEVTEFYLREGQKRLKEKGIKVPHEYIWLEGRLLEDYLHDMKEAQGFAMLNREIILKELEKNMGWELTGYGESIHNYVDENRILRSGAVSAYEGDRVIISVNKSGGMILGTGKGNPDWNYSAPYDAGGEMDCEDIGEAVQDSVTVNQILEPVHYFEAE